MKAFLRLKGRIRPRRKLSAVSYQSSALNGWQLIKYCALDKVRYTRTFLQSILVFVSCSAALAQESVVHTTPANQAEVNSNKITEQEITPLKIGDKIPDELWEMYFPVVSAKSDQVQYLSLGDFKDKLIILDFWSTWCGSCLASMPKLDSLQTEMADELKIIPVSSEKETSVKNYFYRERLSLPSIIGDHDLRKHFPHNYIPYYVWIKDNRVLAFTEGLHVTKENIEKTFMDKRFSLPKRYDNVEYDLYSPLVLNGNGGSPQDVVYQSTITGFLDGVNSVGRIITDTVVNVNKVILPNSTIRGLYTYIIQYENSALRRANRIFYETEKKDIINIVRSPNSYPDLRKYFYSFELIYPSDDRRLLSELVREHLNKYFENTLGITAHIEKRKIMCWVLIESANMKKLPSVNNISSKQIIGDRRKYNNYLLRSFFNELNAANTYSVIPFIDLTEEGVRIDLDMPADLKDLNKVKRSLNKYGFDLIEREEEIEVLVFKDVII